MKETYRKYFGVKTGGIDLLKSLKNLPLGNLEKFRTSIENQPKTGRIFFMGNGGSFDNARLLAQLCRKNDIQSKTPGDSDDYINVAIEKGYAAIYANGLDIDKVGAGDILVGISGSGNSENIVEALEFAKAAGAEVFCMGGRDGGKMRLVCGDDNSMIAKNESMECIEDLHVYMMLIVLRAIKENAQIADMINLFAEKTAQFANEPNIDAITKIGKGILSTIRNNRYLFVLGLGNGANHFRADMGRGASNLMPIRGIAAPEFFTQNSAQATANDDGLDFILADGLVKYNPNEKDFAVLCELENNPAIYAHCKEILDESGTPYVTVGPNKELDLSMFQEDDMQFAMAMVGHASGDIIRRTLLEEFEVRELNEKVEIPKFQKKLGVKETLKVEADFKAKGIISENEVLTFCYGKVYAVDKSNTKLERVYY